MTSPSSGTSRSPPASPFSRSENGKLLGSSLPEPIGDEAKEKAKLEEVVAKVREQEQRYADLEVKARVDYKYLGSDMFMEGIYHRTDEGTALRSSWGLGVLHEHGRYATLGGLRERTKRRLRRPVDSYASPLGAG